MSRSSPLSSRVKITTAVTAAAGASGSTDISGTTLDMLGYDGVVMLVRMGAINGSAVTSIKAQQDSASGMGTAADLAGTAVTIEDDDDDEIFYIDIYRPDERYVRLVVDRGTANAVVASAEYLQYNTGTLPVTQASGTTGEVHIAPAEGTA